MATWKKLVVSGSGLQQLDNSVTQYITAAEVPGAINSFSTASINGVELLADSPSGSFSIVTGSAGTGLTITGTAGTDTISFDLSSIPNSTLANDSVHISGSGISLASVALGATASIDVQVDDSTIEIASDSLQLKDGGTTFAKLADALVITSGEGIAGNDNDTTIATNAAIIDFVESASAAAGALSVGGDGTTSTTIDLDTQTFDFAGANGIEASASAQTITIGIADTSITNAKLVNDGITIAGQDTSLGGTITADTIAGQISNDTITNAQLANDSITIGNETVALGSTITTISGLTASGSFSGSFEGDGSGLTGIATTLNLTDGSNPQAIDLQTETLTFAGTTNEVEVSTATTDTVTIGLPDDVVIGQDLTVTRDATISRNLTVLGTASFQHTEDLDVADRFIRLASGSTSAGDGGIVIQQTGALDGEVFGFDSANTRFGISGSFDASQNVFTPDAFMAAVINTNGNDPNGANAPDSRYEKKGNLYVAGDSEDIWIYS